MLNLLYFKIGANNIGISCDSMSFWQTWKWKLDPYTIKQFVQPLNLCIFLSKSNIKAEPQGMLSEIIVGFFRHRVYSTNTGDYLWQYERIKNGDLVLKYLVSSSLDKITLLEDNSDTNGSLSFEYLGQMMPSILLPSGTISFHGVLMEYAGKGIIISANSGTGKTTHARMWRDWYHALIINGDRSTCRKIDGLWTGYGLPWSGTSGEQINRSVPISAIVVLEQSLENKADVLNGLEAFSAIVPHFLYPRWHRELSSKAMDLLDDFLKQVPVIRLQCRPDKEAVLVLKNVIENL